MGDAMKEVTCLKGEQCDGVDARARFVVVVTVKAVWNACQIRPCIVDVHWSVFRAVEGDGREAIYDVQDFPSASV